MKTTKRTKEGGVILHQRERSGQETRTEFNPSDLLPIEKVARRLDADVGWVREKIRRRCPNPMPVYNLGRHLLFSWSEVCEWIRHSPRPVDTAHVRRKKPVTV